MSEPPIMVDYVKLDSSIIIQTLKSMENPNNVAGMARYGINPEGTLGISIPVLRKIAKKTGVSHPIALELWESGLHEALILAAFIDDPQAVTPDQLEHWVLEFDSWDVTDQVCSNLFDRTPFAVQQAVQWSGREEEFVKRAGFVLMAALAVHDKEMPDKQFEEFLPIIAHEASDERNYVKKGINWALRQIGKRNQNLNQHAIQIARDLYQRDSKAARWVGRDAFRELTSEKVQSKVSKTAQAN